MPFPLGPINDCESRLQRDFSELARLWARVGEDWSDDRRRRFEQEHLRTLGPSLNRFTTTLREFVDTLRKADRATQDEEESRERLE